MHTLIWLNSRPSVIVWFVPLLNVFESFWEDWGIRRASTIKDTPDVEIIEPHLCMHSLHMRIPLETLKLDWSWMLSVSFILEYLAMCFIFLRVHGYTLPWGQRDRPINKLSWLFNNFQNNAFMFQRFTWGVISNEIICCGENLKACCTFDILTFVRLF